MSTQARIRLMYVLFTIQSCSQRLIFSNIFIFRIIQAVSFRRSSFSVFPYHHDIQFIYIFLEVLLKINAQFAFVGDTWFCLNARKGLA